MVQLNKQTFASYVQERYGRPAEGPLNDFISRRNGRLILAERLDLHTLAQHYGAPLEVIYCPLITSQVQQMLHWAAQARQRANYAGAFLYAYATKANFAADAVQTALAAGAHYETSATADVRIAHHLWRQGIVPAACMVFCNGSKEPAYIDAIRDLRLDGHDGVVAILDDLNELARLIDCPAPLRFGMRERAAGNRDGRHLGNDRFGLTHDEMLVAAQQIAASPHCLEVFHAMIGSQLDDQEHYIALMRETVINYCTLRQVVPTLRYLNIGGGMPTSAYNLGFSFDYAGLLTRLMHEIRTICAEFAVPMPDLIGEFGRYTVANHSLFIFEVGHVKTGQGDNPDWYLVNGSFMVSLPDSVLVDQEFIVLPLEGWDAPIRPVRFGGRRTCDSDDVYPRPQHPPLMLPNTGVGTLVAVFGAGAYQQMIAGRGGAHHCLNPEPRRITIHEVAGKLCYEVEAPQDQAEMMRLLGYPARPVRLPIELPRITDSRAPTVVRQAPIVMNPLGRRRERLRLVRER